jgi:hypothetical protein
MGLFANIGKAINNQIKHEKENLTTQVNVVKALSQGDLKKAKNIYVAQVKKNIGRIEDNLKKVSKGVAGAAKNIAAVGGYAPLLPYYLAMKGTLNRRGIKYQNNIVSVANQFFSNVVLNRSNYEDSYDANTRYFGGVDVPVYPQATYVYNNFDAGVDTYCYDLQYNVDGDAYPMTSNFNEVSPEQMEAYKVQAMQAENPAAGQGFDPNNTIGKAIGGLVGGIAGTSAGTAAAAGTAGAGAPLAPVGGAVGAGAGTVVGGGVEAVVKGIIKWFSTLLKAKKEGQNLGEFARTASDATSELSKVTADQAIAMDAVADGSNTGVGEFVEKNKTMLIVAVVVILAVVGFMVFRKK